MRYNRIFRLAYDKVYCTLVTLMILMMPNCSVERVELELQNYYNRDYRYDGVELDVKNSTHF